MKFFRKKKEWDACSLFFFKLDYFQPPNFKFTINDPVNKFQKFGLDSNPTKKLLLSL